MTPVPLGLYISVPFCKTKCSYCNFASGVFSREQFGRYVERAAQDMASAQEAARGRGCEVERGVDSIYLGGGTPSVLEPEQLRQLFRAARENFEIAPGAEITVECAPGTVSSAMLQALVECGANRVSLGVQSFVDREAAAVGRLHTRATVLDDIARLRAAGIAGINVDLIAGLPHQTAETWRRSLGEAIDTGVPHVSVYMLEVDEDSRLGRELLAGGTRYHAHFVPEEDAVAEFYQEACAVLESAGIAQYEISNFARPGQESRHNLKYWTRQPYLGFGVDAHSFLRLRGTAVPGCAEEAVRFSTPDSVEGYLSGGPLTQAAVSTAQALEESFFMGLRLNRGLDLRELAQRFGEAAVARFNEALRELVALGLLERHDNSVRLTSQGRLLSNEVFERFLGAPDRAGKVAISAEIH